jgi:hypothetical protein
MNRTRCLLAAAAALTLSMTANAQPPGYRPPNSSPAYGWLGQNSAAGRLINNVRTQQNNQAALQNLQQQFDVFGRATASPDPNDLTTEGIRPTGRGATFMNYGRYYPRMGAFARTAPTRR